MAKRTMEDSDKISQLPDHIAHQILSFLSIKDAGMTSVLSRKWRYKWSSIPELVFDDRCTKAGGVASLQPCLQENLVKLIDTVLLLHNGPIQKFKISHKGFCATSDIDRWIFHLSRVPIGKIVLCIWKGHKYRIPSSLFNCQELNFLELYNCVVKVPSTFEGLKNLKTLNFHTVELSPDVLEALISCCPLLKRLGLVDVKGMGTCQVNVKVRNLKALYLGGAIPDIVFGDVERLRQVIIKAYCNPSNLYKFFRNLPRTMGLWLERSTLSYLAIGNVKQTLPNALVHLKHLVTCIDFNSMQEILTVICLMRSSPHLRQVDFKARTGKQMAVGTAANSWENHQSSCFPQVRDASLDDISGRQPELDFIKFLLSRLPGLQKMRIKPKSRSEDGKLRGELLQFPRASAQAELIFLDSVNP